MGNPISILLVDDDEDDYILCRRLLTRANELAFRLDWVSTFEDGLRSTQSQTHDVYLIDYALGDGNGLELLRRAIEDGCNAPIIMLTGYGNPEVEAEAMRLGAADYLTKEQLVPQLLGRSIRHALERSLTLRALRESEARHRAVVASLEEGIIVQDADGRVLSCNASAERIMGITFAQMKERGEMGIFMRAVREDGTPFPWDQYPSRLALRTGQPQSNITMGFYKSDANPTWVSVNSQPLIQPGARSPYAVVSSLFDFTTRKRAEDRLSHLAFHDPLTGLPNRVSFLQHLEHALLEARAHNRRIAVAFLDLDRFKMINDTLGHLIGDRLLQQVAARLLASLRPGDILARMGGDEFTLLMRDVREIDEVALLMERLQRALSSPFQIDGHEFFSTTSTGIALAPDHGDDASTLLKNADSAMYQAKESGKNTYCIFHRQLSTTMLQRLELERQLRYALERGELELYYQPQIALNRHEVVGFEALLRWKSSRPELMTPAAFLPVAEESGLIVPIGAWVLEEACRQSVAWQRSGLRPVRIAVNVSATQLADCRFVQVVEGALARTGLQPELLELELTETVVMRHVEASAQQFARLRSLGVNIVIDDFGTGYSSLSYLQRLPLDALKIDRSFVQELDQDRSSVPLVRAILALAKNLRLKVIAEGIETQAQLDQLEHLECDLAQGYLFSPALPAPQVEAFISPQKDGSGLRTPARAPGAGDLNRPAGHIDRDPGR